MTTFDQQVTANKQWFASSRFAGIVRLYSAREVAEQQGTIAGDYAVARQAAEEFYARLRELFEQRKQITTFGPYSPGQAVTLKRIGIDGFSLGGSWSGLGELPAQSSARRGSRARPRTSGGRQKPALRARTDE
jgi:isocitrate lyase